MYAYYSRTRPFFALCRRWHPFVTYFDAPAAFLYAVLVDRVRAAYPRRLPYDMTLRVGGEDDGVAATHKRLFDEMAQQLHAAFGHAFSSQTKVSFAVFCCA